MSSIFKRDLDGIPIIKLTIFGPSLAGKTSLLSIYSILKKVENPDQVYSELKKIEDPSGQTALFDQSVFTLPKGQGTSLPLLRYALYSVAGQDRYRETRKVVLNGTDGLMIMVDPTIEQWEANRASLKELMELLGPELTTGKLPWVFVINKIDLPEDRRKKTSDFYDLMVEVGLVKKHSEAFERVMEMSCLQARNDLLAMPKQKDWKEHLDASGRLKRESRPNSVAQAAKAIEILTRRVIEHKLKMLRDNKDKQ